MTNRNTICLFPRSKQAILTGMIVPVQNTASRKFQLCQTFRNLEIRWRTPRLHPMAQLAHISGQQFHFIFTQSRPNHPRLEFGPSRLHLEAVISHRQHTSEKDNKTRRQLQPLRSAPRESRPNNFVLLAAIAALVFLERQCLRNFSRKACSVR